MGNFSFVATVLNDARSSIDNFAFSAPITLNFLLDPQGMSKAYPTEDNQLRGVAPALLLRNASTGLWVNALHTCSKSQLGSLPRWAFDRTTQIFTARVCHFTQFGIAFQGSPRAAVQSASIDLYYTQNHVQLNSTGTDNDGTIIAYEWTLKNVHDNQTTNSTNITIVHPTSSSTTITGLQPFRQYNFQIQVTDNDFATDEAEVLVTVIGPTDTLTASPPSVTVHEGLIAQIQPLVLARDAIHRVNVFATDTITISAQDNNMETVTGTTSIQMVNGLAQFSDLAFSHSGEYTLVFRSLQSSAWTSQRVTVLSPCGPGTSLGSASECLPCERGKMKAGNGYHECTPCEAGTYAPSEGSSTCTDCLSGTFSSSTGSTTCQDCPLDTVSPQGSVSASACVQLGASETTTSRSGHGSTTAPSTTPGPTDASPESTTPKVPDPVDREEKQGIQTILIIVV
eukprot:442241-Rhodomonas_salina.1